MNRNRIARWALNGFAGFVLVYLFMPIAWIVWFSFNKPKGRYNLVWQTFTLDNWHWDNMFRNRELTDAFVESLKIAAISTTIATTLGSLIAIALSRYRFKGSGGLNLFLVLPLTTPEIVLGSSLATLFLDSDFDRGFRTVVIAHVMFQVSFVAMTVRARARTVSATKLTWNITWAITTVRNPRSTSWSRNSVARDEPMTISGVVSGSTSMNASNPTPANL